MDARDELYWRAMRKGWNVATPEYGRSWVPLLQRRTARCVDLARIGPGDRVVDIACGTGAATFLAAERVGAAGSVLGTDFSHEMVAAGEAEARARGLPNVRFERHRMESLELSDASYDVALCAFGLFYASPVEQALSEMHRVLRPGGRFSVVVWGRRDRCGFREVFGLIGSRVGMEVCPLFFSLGPPGALTSALARAGFADVAEDREEGTDRFASGALTCAAMFRGGPVAAVYEQMSEDVRAELDAEYLETLAAYRDGDAYLVPYEVVLATGRKL